MSLLQQIKTAQLEARKTHNVISTNVLTTLIGEAEMVGKNSGNREVTDSEVVAMVKKFVGNINQTIEILNKEGWNHQKIYELETERTILEQFLPPQLTDLQLTEAIASIVAELNATSVRDMGKVMKVLKERYDGQYDGATASTFIKGMLT